jgi:hypothetical protein
MLGAFYRDRRVTMRSYARRLLHERQCSKTRADTLSEDIVHEVMIYHLGRGLPWDARDGDRIFGAIRFYVQKALDDERHVVEVRNTSAGKRARITNVFPTQIFGCALADSFGGPPDDDESLANQ